MRTEYRSPPPRVPLLCFKNALPRKTCINFPATVSFLNVYNLLPGDDTFAVMRCNGNGNVVEQRTFGSGSTIPAFSRHVTVY
jgi:hypothetical protein